MLRGLSLFFFVFGRGIFVASLDGLDGQLRWGSFWGADEGRVSKC